MIYLLRVDYRYNRWYNKQADSFPTYLIYSIIGGILFILYLVDSASSVSVRTMMIFYSHWLEVFALLPQIVMLYRCNDGRSGRVEGLHLFIACFMLGSWRMIFSFSPSRYLKCITQSFFFESMDFCFPILPHDEFDYWDGHNGEKPDRQAVPADIFIDLFEGSNKSPYQL